MSWTCEIDAASIVLVGKFNPSIFQPAWLAANHLIRQEEADAAIQPPGIDIINRDVCVFTADWLNLQVTQTRFAANALDAAHQVAVRDLVLGIFTLLEHTPFDQMGLNRDMHYKIESREKWHALGDLLAPKDCWKPMMDQPGLRTLVIENHRDEAPMPKLTVKVEPSSRISPGVNIVTNLHYQAEGPEAARELLKRLNDSWEEAQAQAKSIAEHLLKEQC